MFRPELNVLAVLAALMGAGAVPAHPESLNDRLQQSLPIASRNLRRFPNSGVTS
jgi:hypothetical protein